MREKCYLADTFCRVRERLRSKARSASAEGARAFNVERAR
jgi:hypothetical protein